VQGQMDITVQPFSDGSCNGNSVELRAAVASKACHVNNIINDTLSTGVD
jgi:hypothetical protein